MPAFFLFHGRQTVARFDALAEYSKGARSFVRHVALYDDEALELSDEQVVEVVHMGPPLSMVGRIKARAVGSVPLSTDEIKEVASWTVEIDDEYQREGANWLRQYVIDPPWRDEIDPNTGVRRYRRFSCAGFVLDAHNQVGIPLLVIDKEKLPEVNEATLELAYPDHRFRRLREELGLPGHGPWRIVLAGYVLHALNRTSEEIRRKPYQAHAGDESF